MAKPELIGEHDQNAPVFPSAEIGTTGQLEGPRHRDYCSQPELLDGAETCPECHVFQLANTKALRHGGRRSLDRPGALASMAAAKEQAVRQHLGDDPSVTLADLGRDYARTDVLIESVASNIEVGGIFTAKGKRRAAVGLLLSLMDRRHKLAVTLGLERKAKPVVDGATYLKRLAAEREQREKQAQ